MKNKLTLADIQPQEMRALFPVPFRIPDGLDMTCETRVYFAAHPDEFPGWFEDYRLAQGLLWGIDL